MELSKSLIKRYKAVRLDRLEHGTFLILLIDGIEVPFAVEDDYPDPQGEGKQVSWEGYRLIDSKQGELGAIRSVDTSTINIVAELEDGRLIPLHEDFVEKVDDKKRCLYLTLPFTL